MPLNQLTIMEKARSTFTYIQDEKGEKSETLGASKAWFAKFKKRLNLHRLKRVLSGCVEFPMFIHYV